jgi:hypothetical protein
MYFSVFAFCRRHDDMTLFLSFQVPYFAKQQDDDCFEISELCENVCFLKSVACDKLIEMRQSLRRRQKEKGALGA